MKLLLSLLIGSLLGGEAMAQTTTTLGQKPNIIFIMADDLGHEALACYGNDVNKTPHLDQLAAEGMKFTDAHATPLCTPSRVQVMTGKYNNRNYMVFGLLNKDEKTFADYLKEAGYATGVAGKWQLLGNKKQREKAGGKIGSRPEEVGFDQYCLWQLDELGSRYKDPTISTTTGTEILKGEFGPDVFSDFAVTFIREHRLRPFFLYYPMVLTHDPFQPTPDNGDYADMPVKGTNDPKYFRDQVEYMDKIVGRIVAELKSQGLADNTLLIFTGDNGTGKKVVSLVDGKEVSGGKGNTSRSGTHVPFIAKWPGQIKAGQVNDNLVDLTDVLPTLLDVAGHKVDAAAGLDGISLLPQLLGKDGPVRPWVFCYYHPQLYHDRKAVWAHGKTWKLYDDGLFFNMKTDPDEQKPLRVEGLSGEATDAYRTLKAAIAEQTGGQ